MVDERIPISATMKIFSQKIDGKSWLLVSSIASLVAVIEVSVGMQLLPIRKKSDSGKAVLLRIGGNSTAKIWRWRDDSGRVNKERRAAA